jgi:UDP-4-amino-4,6-dideoxy-N-acetyl-beta-L-altrosamine transaminase
VIPYGRQHVDDDDIQAVVDVLRGDWLTTGPHVEEFERALARRVGAMHAVSFANGTAALHGACAAAGLGPDDVIATSTLSFAASAACARYVGAEVRLLDIDPNTLNVDPAAVPPDIDAFVAVHFAGLPLDLRALAHRPRVIIEDAAHAIGADTPDGPIGSCAHSDLCCFSFHPVKTITTGEGGAVTTNDAELADRMRRFRNHGMALRPELGGWYYEIDDVGYNYRLNDIQAALGTSQLPKLDGWIVRRNELAARYRRLLEGSSIVLPPEPPAGFTHGRHLYPVRVNDRRRVYEELRAAGIGAQVHYVPIHRQPAYAPATTSPADFPHAERAYEGLLSIPLFSDLTERDQDAVVQRLLEATCPT